MDVKESPEGEVNEGAALSGAAESMPEDVVMGMAWI
jgi:hypothetical protein